MFGSNQHALVSVDAPSGFDHHALFAALKSSTTDSHLLLSPLDALRHPTHVFVRRRLDHHRAARLSKFQIDSDLYSGNRRHVCGGKSQQSGGAKR